MKKQITLKERLQYSFDKTMSKGTPALIMWLAILSICLVLIFSAISILFNISPEGETQVGFIEMSWRSLMRTLDAGTMGGDMGWSFRILMLFVTIGGIFIVSTLIGVLSSGIESKLDDIRKGRSFVIETNHTLILGWSPKVFTIINELVIANENQKNPRIVILAPEDKVAMEDEIREKISTLKNTKVICRSGSPNDISDIDMVNPQESKSIIILSPESDDADSQTIKTILAVTNNPNRRNIPYNIVAEIKQEKYLNIAQIVGKDEVELLLIDDLVARIMVQTCRQKSLSVVYNDLMGFEGSEMYFNEEPKLVGKSYQEALIWYEDSAVIGIRKSEGEIFINPPKETLFKEGDAVLAITEDDDTLIISEKEGDVDNNAITQSIAQENSKEKTLILGWNHRGNTIIQELNNYVKEGSEVLVISDFEVNEKIIATIKSNYKNLVVNFQTKNTNDPEIINNLPLDTFHQIIVLSYMDEMELQQADSKTLITLLLLRNYADSNQLQLNIVSEMMDMKNRELAAVTKANDFIVSDKMLSMLIAQISENKDLMRVYNDLFQDEGSEIYLKPASDYVKIGVPVNFYTIVASAAFKGQSAFGYSIDAQSFDSRKSYGIYLNPNKSEFITFSTEDRIIVMAED